MICPPCCEQRHEECEDAKKDGRLYRSCPCHCVIPPGSITVTPVQAIHVREDDGIPEERPIKKASPRHRKGAAGRRGQRPAPDPDSLDLVSPSGIFGSQDNDRAMVDMHQAMVERGHQTSAQSLNPVRSNGAPPPPPARRMPDV